MINNISLVLVGVAIAWIVALVFTMLQVDKKLYHCHGKNFVLMETVIDGSNIYVKTKPERFCIDIRDVKERKKKWIDLQNYFTLNKNY